MNISELLSTQERIKLLKNVIYKTQVLNVNSVARDAKLSKGLISKVFGLLLKMRILKRRSGRLFVENNLRTKAIRIILNLNNFDTDFFKKYRFIRAAGLYGSVVKGTNTEESDIDLWLIIDKVNEETLAKLTNELRYRFGNVKPLYLSREKLVLLKKSDAVFYYSLVFGSITIFGDGIEAV